ncbi:DUF2141 domain-containing protein [Maribacter sp. MMG018]|uniref:DUF2141 domain-containing protein n=1 Tax=Maribacter sp. MMG018 TaxID=2822688 RepID=UPI001B370F62|nr:DUF2141 domain-containing protein [Maribacter sp. MMG018]MBQ4914741.1 DUF2141 domain-containing protein [Maribacter sp. MMG018]
MKRLGLILVFALATVALRAQEDKGVTVKVTIENILSDKGNVIGSLHTAETFMKGPGIINTEVDAVKGEVTLVFSDVEPGTFALMLMHDENENNRMDFESNGMPKESFATSGDMSFGPPTFENAKFEVADKDIDLRLRF